MQFLSKELGDRHAKRCGKCANCTGVRLGKAYSRELVEQATRFLEHPDLPIEPREQWPANAGFEGERGSIPVEWQPRPGRALCRWGDPGLGELVKEGKRNGNFSRPLVDAAAELIQGRWEPRPAPEWITCVPSRRNPTLVPGFARRLAAQIGLPFVECIRKVRDTEPQKSRQNSFQQVRNLENAFTPDPKLVRAAAVLLVDDMVDSRWTFTCVSLKLKLAGAGPVFPFALADSSSR